MYQVDVIKGKTQEGKKKKEVYNGPRVQEYSTNKVTLIEMGKKQKEKK